MTERPVECKTRRAARLLARQTHGKVQGYIAAVGWIDDTRIPESEEKQEQDDAGNEVAN